jgi:multisubunit Na+/H+ antiporter MnhG subunit
MVYVIILRLIKGKSPFFGSPDHFALRLKKKYTLSPAKTVSVIIGIQLILSGVVILNFYTTPLVTIISTAVILLFFVTFGLVLALVKMD